MQEVKKPSKRPLVFYYLIGMLILMVLNMTFFPAVLEKQVQEVSYSTFMSMTYEDNIGLVQIEGDAVSYTHLDVYKRQGWVWCRTCCWR